MVDYSKLGLNHRGWVALESNLPNGIFYRDVSSWQNCHMQELKIEEKTVYGLVSYFQKNVYTEYV